MKKVEGESMGTVKGYLNKISVVIIAIILILLLFIAANFFREENKDLIKKSLLQEEEKTQEICGRYEIHKIDGTNIEATIIFESNLENIEYLCLPDGNIIKSEQARKVIAVDYSLIDKNTYEFKIKVENNVEETWTLVAESGPPTINMTTSESYAKITKEGVILEKTASIEYGVTEAGYINYYSIDEGKTWQEYTGEIEIDKKIKCILAKSIIDSEKTKTIERIVRCDTKWDFAEDAVTLNAYDENESTSMGISDSYKYIKIAPEMQGYEIKIKGQIIYSTFVGSDKTTVLGNEGWITSEKTLRIPNEAEYLRCTNYSGTWGYINEIIVVSSLKVDVEKTYVYRIAVNTSTNKLEGNLKYDYYIKLETDSKYELKTQNSTDTEYIYTDLLDYRVYDIKVVVKDEKGNTYECITSAMTKLKPEYCTEYEINNISEYGYDIYIYGVDSSVKTIRYPTWTDNNGQDDLGTWQVATKMEDGTTYYCRVNTNEHNDEAKLYITHIYFYNSVGSILSTLGTSVNVPVKDITNKGIIEGESIIEGIKDNDISTGCYNLTVTNKKTYAIEVLNVNSMQDVKYDKKSNTYTIAGAILGTATAGRMAVLKCDGNLEIYGTVTTATGKIDGYTGLTKVKGLFICVTGTITFNGTITMTARGTYNTAGEDVYLWKNTDGSYEYVPAEGAAGGTGVQAPTANKKPYSSKVMGKDGTAGTERRTGGGGSGASRLYQYGLPYGSKGYWSGSGSKGTSYSGGTGGGGAYRTEDTKTGNAGNGQGNGGAGGNGSHGQGGAGNPGGSDNGINGTGGLIIVHSNEILGTGKIEANGSTMNESISTPGGGSGAGSVNIFAENISNGIKIEAEGKGSITGKGGNGSITIGSISTGKFEKK